MTERKNDVIAALVDATFEWTRAVVEDCLDPRVGELYKRREEIAEVAARLLDYYRLFFVATTKLNTDAMKVAIAKIEEAEKDCAALFPGPPSHSSRIAQAVLKHDEERKR